VDLEGLSPPFVVLEFTEAFKAFEQADGMF